MWTAHAIAINEELFLREGHARAFILRDAWMGCKIASWIYKLVDINAWQGPDAVNNVDTNELDNWGGSSFHYSVYMYTPRRNSSSNLFLEPGITSNVDYVLRKTCLWIVCIGWKWIECIVSLGHIVARDSSQVKFDGFIEIIDTDLDRIYHINVSFDNIDPIAMMIK